MSFFKDMRGDTDRKHKQWKHLKFILRLLTTKEKYLNKNNKIILKVSVKQIKIQLKKKLEKKKS